MNWPHAPAHHFTFGNTFFITAATLHKQQLYTDPAALDELQEILFANAEKYSCELQAWCLLTNHYHLVVRGDGTDVHKLIERFHTEASAALNARDDSRGRKVWFQFWDTTLTFAPSWLVRLRYTHENAVHHGIVADARRYRWCSASWFERTASSSLVATVRRMKIDRVKVYDAFEERKAAAMPPHS